MAVTGGKPKKRAPKKRAAKKPATKKRAAKKPAAKKKRKPNPAFMVPLKPDAVLAAIVGSKPLPRSEITKQVWVYIKRKKLQDTAPKMGQWIIAKKDPAMRKFLGKDRAIMFEIAKAIKKHTK